MVDEWGFELRRDLTTTECNQRLYIYQYGLWYNCVADEREIDLRRDLISAECNQRFAQLYDLFYNCMMDECEFEL